MPAKFENAKLEDPAGVVKPYRKPSLAKGPVLAKITAQAVSGIPSDGAICWVARAAFGEQDFRWMIFRAWLFEDAPRVLLRVYLGYGEAVGAFVARHEFARRIVRRMMLPAIRRKARG